jgi:hypothetical protein
VAADIFELVNQLSVLLAARRPQWVEQLIPVGGYLPAQTTDTPVGAGAGVSLQDSPRSTVIIDLRRNNAFRTVRITVRVVDLTSTYRVTIDGTNVDYSAVGDLDLEDLVQGWRDLINVTAPANTVVTARTEDTNASGTDDTLVIEGDTALGYAFGVDVTVGAGEVDAIADASTAQAHLWFSAKPVTSSDPDAIWRQANGAAYPVARRGFIERFDTGGLDRAFVELAEITGNTDTVGAPSTLKYYAQITVGPAVLEIT